MIAAHHAGADHAHANRASCGGLCARHLRIHTIDTNRTFATRAIL
jgi:hypothetical protein